MSKSIRVKIKCVNTFEDEFGQGVAMNVVPLPTEENKSISKGAPQGELKFRIEKDTPAYGTFIPGEEYFVDFSPAPKTVFEEPELEAVKDADSDQGQIPHGQL